ncbi:Glucoamylase (glucan-1,4-alpha-glucosidase), GH15 family [Actinacidiphila yanglinensis]|uniref:Glucoamylase (Glucan-1,4-alpha-glucosidase), GH15 family n=1 Tax=Actinacidiphila yanglinensis TaxID=310779 RepID=A0A1H5YWN7_9ACTN|nr:glycoside hydrolase family 15 protein [Actinacidiphila yanglinensis]SEG28202.1 Glucoamylase (glucan-1,4-alpha-glucosidase), GH15 family [Actinacidiphila yanglinensis]
MRTAIGDYALLSDCQTAALVSKGGAIDWLCLPCFDSRAVFARVLGEDAGHWSIAPRGESAPRRSYLAGSLVLRTEYRTPAGEVAVTDALATGPNAGGHELGADAPHVLVRVLEGIRGDVEIEAEFAPRPEYGLVRQLLIPVDGGLRCHGGPHALGLSSPVPLDVSDCAHARFTVRPGERIAFALDYVLAGQTPRLRTPEETEDLLAETLGAWRGWSALHERYRGAWQDEVHHSGRVLQALTYRPSGAIVAAPTTSLPEAMGGPRNWDYRYSWVRDAAFALNALWTAACPDEAVAFFDWMAQAAAADPRAGRDLQIVFGVRGECDLTERELGHLPGWRDSSPVRIGNDAWQQRQLDVYGELLCAAHRLRAYLPRADATTLHFLASLVDTACARWKEPDEGIWEVRSGRRHFVYSKLMCWMATRCGIQMADLLGAEDRVPYWRRVGDEIRAAIEEQGWNDEVGAYTQAFGSRVLDASTLMMPLVGFAPADDPRMLATIHAIHAHLTDARGMVYRYAAMDDGLDGGEGTFLLCTFWLAGALALAGEVDEAERVFERAAATANDVGLMAEEVDTRTGELLGNFPQAFSHVGLVNAAWMISRVRSGAIGPQNVADGSAFCSD